MTTYRRKQTATIEATQFTSAHGGCARGVTPGSAPDGLVYSEQGGYSYHGARIAFGDYMVGNGVMAREEFEAQYEPVVPFAEPGRLEFARVVANSPVTKALDAALDAHAPRQAPAATKRGTRRLPTTEEYETQERVEADDARRSREGAE
jgi:hypothetical protein